MKYVFDTNCFINLFTNIYKSRFPSLWQLFYEFVEAKRIISVREVVKEIDGYGGQDRLKAWVKDNSDIFEVPTESEIEFTTEIFRTPHYQGLVPDKSILIGKHVADPFIIAKAKITGAWVVTLETFRENAAKIPNVCQHFNIPYTDLEGFMERENWEF